MGMPRRRPEGKLRISICFFFFQLNWVGCLGGLDRIGSAAKGTISVLGFGGVMAPAVSF